MFSVACAGVTPPASTIARNTRMSRKSRSVSWENMIAPVYIDINRCEVYSVRILCVLEVEKNEDSTGFCAISFAGFIQFFSLVCRDETFFLRFPRCQRRTAATALRQPDGALRRHHDDDAFALCGLGRRARCVLCRRAVRSGHVEPDRRALRAAPDPFGIGVAAAVQHGDARRAVRFAARGGYRR